MTNAAYDYGRWRTDRARFADYLEALAVEIRAGRGPGSIDVNTHEERDPLHRGGMMVAVVRRAGFIARDAVLEKAVQEAEAARSENTRLRAEVKALRALVESG